MQQRRKTRAVHIGQLSIGGDAPVAVQSMTCTKTEDVKATVEQIHQLEAAGCEIVRVAVPTETAADALKEIRKSIHIPLVADIHFDYRLALRAIENGVDKIRINPGNIGSRDRVEEVLRKAGEKKIPIRIGVNAGSLDKDLIQKYGGVCAEALVESASKHVNICREFGFEDLVLSVKSSNVPLMIETNRLLSQKFDYPLHLGVTEAGTPKHGILRSAVGVGTLLAEGIGDTIRISLTGDPVREIEPAFEILKSLGLRKHGITLISCPTCGRTQTRMAEIAEQVEEALSHITRPLKVAVMGCAVNGPGEAREADVGVACGKESALLFKKGEVVRKIREDEIVRVLLHEVEHWDE